MDFGCFHVELDDAKRTQERRAATAAAAPDASLLLLAWRPARRRFLPRDASREEIEAAFPEWTITDDVAMDVTARRGMCEEPTRASTGSSGTELKP